MLFPTNDLSDCRYAGFSGTKGSKRGADVPQERPCCGGRSFRMQMKTEYAKFAVVCERLITQVKTDHHRRVLAEKAETWRKIGRGGGQARDEMRLVDRFFGIACDCFRQAEPHLRHLDQSGPRVRARGDLRQLQTFLREAAVFF